MTDSTPRIALTALALILLPGISAATDTGMGLAVDKTTKQVRRMDTCAVQGS